MKKIMRLFAVFSAFAAVVGFSGCSLVEKVIEELAGRDGGEICGEPLDGGYGGAYADADGGDVSEGAENGESQDRTVAAGQLTAGEWKDNKHYDMFKDLFTVYESCVSPYENGEEEELPENGGFSGFLGENAWGMSVLNRVEVSVTDGDGNAAAGAWVAMVSSPEESDGATEEGVVVYAQAVVGADGKGYLFPEEELSEGQFRIVGGYGGDVFDCTAAVGSENGYTLILEESRAYTSLDLCFMIDTTGSMGDELSYLKAEIGDVISKVQAEFPAADINLGLVFYRDEEDSYVTKVSDFTSDIGAQQAVLAGEVASGGGDYPEAVHEAFAAALGLSWRKESKKILIPVLDAPPHEQKTEQGQTRDIRAEYGGYVYEAAAKGISVVPVAASGVDLTTQYLLRSTALITGGTYIFITDDSGIGLEHDKPLVGEYTVEYLNACLVRVIGELFDGCERPAVPYYQAQQ